MNVTVPLKAVQPNGVSTVQDERGLESFRDAACAAVIWHREMPVDIRTWLSSLEPKALPSGRVVLQAKAVADTVRDLCDIAQMPTCQQRDWLIADISNLAHCFVALMGARYLRLRLQAVTTNACRRFHLDAISGRLVCTYRGTGTQYGTSDQGGDPVQVSTVPTGDPILLRGTLWPADPSSGLLHRSPPIEGTGETRLVLVLDPIFDLEEAE
ncbi:DUF1826 domain-containing protein [Tateyamaria sp.]|uniref:DUF1826 domain-containing protein n=1 Tax=Tateyamaria sp. TaxID=1929288 RepID=UPI00329D65D7